MRIFFSVPDLRISRERSLNLNFFKVFAKKILRVSPFPHKTATSRESGPRISPNFFENPLARSTFIHIVAAPKSGLNAFNPCGCSVSSPSKTDFNYRVQLRKTGS